MKRRLSSIFVLAIFALALALGTGSEVQSDSAGGPFFIPMADASVTGNCVGVVYEDMSFNTVPWTDVDQLNNELRYLIVVVFHQQGTPPTPSNSVVFLGLSEIIGLVPVGSDLIVRRVADSPNLSDRSIFRADDSQKINEGLPEVSRHARVGGSPAVLFTFPLNDPDYDDKTDAAQAIEDIGPCTG